MVGDGNNLEVWLLEETTERDMRLNLPEHALHQERVICPRQ